MILYINTNVINYLVAGCVLLDHLKQIKKENLLIWRTELFQLSQNYDLPTHTIQLYINKSNKQNLAASLNHFNNLLNSDS